MRTKIIFMTIPGHNSLKISFCVHLQTYETGPISYDILDSWAREAPIPPRYHGRSHFLPKVRVSDLRYIWWFNAKMWTIF